MERVQCLHNVFWVLHSSTVHIVHLLFCFHNVWCNYLPIITINLLLITDQFISDGWRLFGLKFYLINNLILIMTSVSFSNSISWRIIFPKGSVHFLNFAIVLCIPPKYIPLLRTNCQTVRCIHLTYSFTNKVFGNS